ncbi:MAG: DNA gyrase inhibitor YacG [Gammaproteobacteria bacterium]|nr:DNA gyrase inhibitor YacG [Gammaproteobacteria bacterium]
MSEPSRIISCPTCKGRVKWTPANPFRPFCSERCRLIDLGAWAGEEHRIAGTEPVEFDGSSDD